ncbi:GOLPH3/VPS74 family protein [Asanoa iriomotensis]|uniref:DUF6545 domain-containing protein n=1 Tax=Asanoa iriomotensis TaxID=234613 RepID=A0ABQ4CCJ3_9ACTN|nr:MAB_1171c family putative transporter [Asanoa iriomotensis]GIF60483.1 hypothetical protein Air01nite_65780 [Asanoa iriomotensis]
MTGTADLLVAAFVLVVLVHKGTHLCRDPGNPAVRAMNLTLLCLMAAVVVGWDPVYVLVDQAAGVPNLARYLTHSFGLVAAAAIQTMFLFLANPATAVARSRRRWALLMLTLVVMGVTFSGGDFTIEDPDDFTLRYAYEPQLLVYMVAFLGYCALGTADVLRMSVRYSRLVSARHLRVGIGLLAVGVAGGIVFGVHKLAFIVLRASGVDVGWSEPSISRALVLFAVVATTAGLAVPSLGPYLADAVGWPRQYRLYRDLEPLWKAIYRVSQSAVLNPPLRRPSVADMRLQIDRRVIEIHDGLRELSPYLDPAVAERATGAALRDGAPVEHARAVGQAASVAAAIARMTAVSAGSAPATERTGQVALVDFDANAAGLASVSRAYARDRRPTGSTLARRSSIDEVPLAGAFYLLAHDAATGRPRLRARAIDVTLAAGLLAEVLFLDLARVEGRQLIAVDGPVPADPLIRQVAHAVGQETHTVRTWLDYLSETALDDVIQRLHDGGIIAPIVARTVFRTTTVWRPTEPSIVASSSGRLALLLRTGAELAPPDVALVGLMHAAELDDILLFGAERPAREHLADVLRGTSSSLRILLTETQTLLGADVLARRM